MGIFSKRNAVPNLAIDSVGPTYSEPNESEINWMLGHLQFASEMDVDIDDLDQVSSFYDTLLRSWTDSPPRRVATPTLR
jgi:hypothetical protein